MDEVKELSLAKVDDWRFARLISRKSEKRTPHGWSWGTQKKTAARAVADLLEETGYPETAEMFRKIINHRSF